MTLVRDTGAIQLRDKPLRGVCRISLSWRRVLSPYHAHCPVQIVQCALCTIAHCSERRKWNAGNSAVRAADKMKWWVHSSLAPVKIGVRIQGSARMHTPSRHPTTHPAPSCGINQYEKQWAAESSHTRTIVHTWQSHWAPCCLRKACLRPYVLPASFLIIVVLSYIIFYYLIWQKSCMKSVGQWIEKRTYY